MNLFVVLVTAAKGESGSGASMIAGYWDGEGWWCDEGLEMGWRGGTAASFRKDVVNGMLMMGRSGLAYASYRRRRFFL